MSLDERSTSVALRLVPNDSRQPEERQITVGWIDEVPVMVLSGEIDLSVATTLDEHVREMAPGLSSPGLIVDMARVTFLDSTGLSFLMTTDGKVRARGGHLIVYAPPTQVRDLFDLSGLSSVLSIVP